jgi:hypothetical protein
MISFFLLCASHALCALALGSSPVNLAELQSRDLENRETACIAVGDCPSHQDPSSSSSPPPPPPSTSSSNPPPPPSTTNTPQPSSSSSSPPTPSPSAQNVTRYLLFPKTGASKDETDKFEKLLIKVVGVPGEIYESSAIGLGVVFWTAPLTADQAKECASYNLVSPSRKSYPIFRY